jgi:hypothetical protein
VDTASCGNPASAGYDLRIPVEDGILHAIGELSACILHYGPSLWAQMRFLSSGFPFGRRQRITLGQAP